MQQPYDFLTPEKLQLFVAGLSGLAPEEVRKAKLLYLRNAISEFQAMQTSYQGFGQAQGVHVDHPHILADHDRRRHRKSE